MMKRAGRNTLIIIWAVVILVASLVVAGYFLDSAQEAAARASLDATNYLLKAREAYSFLVDMETSQRGYLLSGDEKFLGPYNNAVAAQNLPALWQTLETDASDIEQRTSNEESLPRLVHGMRQAAERWQTEAAEPQIQMVRKGFKSEAVSAEEINKSKQLFDVFRSMAKNVDDDLNDHINANTHNGNQINTLRQWLLLGLSALTIGSAILATRIAQRESKLQEETTRIAEAERRRLQIIVDNLPIAVRLVSAPDGDVLIQNRAADELLPTEAWNNVGRRERISHFSIRKPDGRPLSFDDMPVIRTLHEGITLRDQELWLSLPGLGSRILLSSTAPLRDEKGNIVAAVNVLQDVTAMKELDLRKDEFIATAAHELRNPLTTISGYNQLVNKLLATTNAPPKAMTYLTAMTTQLARLNSLVEHLLDASRIQLGRLVLEKSKFDLADLARLVAADVKVDEVGVHSVKVTAPPGGVTGEWDRSRIEQVLTNLLSNAMRYSPSDKPVEIVVEKKGKEARVKVIDQGPGVSPEQRHTLFDRYSQGADTPSPLSTNLIMPPRKRGALGLGLYLSSEIVKAHGGTIGMDPNPAGGSIFWFVLPITSERTGGQLDNNPTTDDGR